jgi:hypothetical protein
MLITTPQKWLGNFKQYFASIVAFSFICGENQRKLMTVLSSTPCNRPKLK